MRKSEASNRELERCRWEQLECEAIMIDGPAWLAAIWWADWEAEAFLIRAQAQCVTSRPA